MTSGRGRISRKRVQEALARVQDDPCLLQDLARFERLKRWTVDLVVRLHPGDRTTAYRHLERLVTWGCLGKHKGGGRGGGGSTPTVYYLSALGARVLTHALERERPVTYVRQASRSQETHDLAMAELATDWGLLGHWNVQVPIPYTRNALIVKRAREYEQAVAKHRNKPTGFVPQIPMALRILHQQMALDDPLPPLEQWVAGIRPIPGRIIPDFWTLLPDSRADARDWLVCVEIEGRTEKRHIEAKYWRYAEAHTALPHALAPFVVFISERLAKRALPQHRWTLNRILKETDRGVFIGSLLWVLFSNLDYLRKQEKKGNPFVMTDKSTHIWENVGGMGGTRGVLKRTYEDPYEQEEQERRDRARRAYWASQR
jgi:hypothetical protein